jgi:hypothetical protein
VALLLLAQEECNVTLLMLNHPLWEGVAASLKNFEDINNIQNKNNPSSALSSGVHMDTNICSPLQ